MSQGLFPSLAQQAVLITGAANGLGRALARAFGAVGSKLILIDFNEKALLETAEQLPTASLYVADLSDAVATRAMIARVQAEHRTVHTLIHNAGFLVPELFIDMSEASWERTFNVGIQAARLLTKAFWADWQETGGVAIFVSSRSGIEPDPGEAAYCSTKHALEGFAKVLALEGDASGILVHSVTPGMFMRTPMSEQNYTAESKAQWVDPFELTPAFLHLARRQDPALSGKRLSAWQLSQQLSAHAVT